MSSVAEHASRQKCNKSAGAPVADKNTEAPPRIIRPSPGAEPLYLVTTFRGGESTQATLTRQEVLALDPEDVDFHHDQVFGRVSIRLPDGSFRKHRGEIPGLGPDVGLPVLDNVVWAMGEFLTTRDFNGLLDDEAVRATQVYRLRKAFGDSCATQWYFSVKCRPWRCAWNIERSFRVIERLA